MPDEEADFSSISKYILHLLKKKILKNYTRYMKTVIYLFSRIRYLILAVKGQNNRLKKHHHVFCNVNNKQSTPSFSKTALLIFQLKSDF